MDMQKMWNAYAQECRVLRERIAALRQALEDEKLMPMERHELDRRKRLLSEEARDLEWSMRSIAVYAAQEKAGMPYAHDRQNRMGRDVVSGGSPGGALGKTACRLSDRKKYYGKRDLGETKTDPRVIL